VAMHIALELLFILRYKYFDSHFLTFLKSYCYYYNKFLPICQ
jgi:hypothetical protein